MTQVVVVVVRVRRRRGGGGGGGGTQMYESELSSCVKVEVAVLGSPSLIVLMVFVDVENREVELGSHGLS